MGFKREKQKEPRVFELIEEAFQLLRLDPVRRLAPYYTGTLPFLLTLLYFWADMSKSAFAAQRLPVSSLLLVITFIWMKAWQVVYLRRLWAETSAQPVPCWTFARLRRMVVNQAILQPIGLLALPFSLLMLVPFPYVHAFFQNLSVLDDGEEDSALVLAKRAMVQARLWPKQNSLLIWILSPSLLMLTATFYLVLMPVMRLFSPEWSMMLLGVYAAFLLLLLIPLCPLGVVISGNLVAMLVFVPYLAKSLLGIDFGIGSMGSSFQTSTFAALVVSLVFGCMDPLMKAAYLLRCFSGASIHTGEDLLVALRQHAGRLLSLVVVMIGVLWVGSIFGGAVLAADNDPSPVMHSDKGPGDPSSRALDEALNQLLQERRYAWRLPPPEGKEDDSWLGGLTQFLNTFFDSLKKWIKQIGDWMDRIIKWLFDKEPVIPAAEGGLGAVSVFLRTLLIVLVSAIILLIGFILFKIWRKSPASDVSATGITAGILPDVADDQTLADQYPEEEWVGVAQDLARRQEWRLAIRALFLAMLARMAARDWIRIARFKSNRDYRLEFSRRVRTAPDLMELFCGNLGIYESTWYGMHEATSIQYERMMANQEQMRSRG